MRRITVPLPDFPSTVVTFVPSTRRVLSAASVLLALLATASCKETLPGPPAIDRVVVSPATFTLALNGSQQLNAAALDKDGQAIPNKPIGFVSSNPSVATVTNTGLVIAVGLGETFIDAIAEGKHGKASVTVVRNSPASITIEPAGGQAIRVGDQFALRATLRDNNGAVITDRTVNWSSSAPHTATVTSTGALTASVAGVAQGNATITAEVDGRSANVSFVVNPIASSISITPPGPQILRVTNTLQLAAVLRDASGNVVTGRPVTWTSLNPIVATVTQGGGLVTAVAPGTTTIIADSEGKQAQIAITVTLVPVASATVAPRTTTMLETQSQQFAVTLKDSVGNTLSPNGRSIQWVSTNLPVATVSAAGVVSAVAAGTAKIAVTVDQVSDTAVVTVNRVPVSAVVVNPISINNLKVGTSFGISATPVDSVGNTLRGRVTVWSSADGGIATVSNIGVVTGIAPGTVKIRATVEGVIGESTVTVVP